MALSARTGAQLWTQVFADGGATGLRFADGVLYAAQQYGLLAALNTATGAELWTFSVRESATDELSFVVVAHGIVYAANLDGAIYALQA